MGHVIKARNDWRDVARRSICNAAQLRRVPVFK